MSPQDIARPTKSQSGSTTSVRIGRILGVVQLITGLLALPAGVSLVLDPSGSGIGFDSSLLASTPFKDYLLPGLLMLFGNGLCHILGALVSLKLHRYSGMLGIALGFCLIMWVIIQVYYVGILHGLQHIFVVLGLAEILLGYALVEMKVNKRAGRNFMGDVQNLF